MRRRTFLRSLTGVPAAGLAGCLGSDGDSDPAGGDTTTGGTPSNGGTPADDGSPTTEPATDPTSTPTATPAGAVSVTVDALQPALVVRNTPDSIGVSGSEFQYLSLSVEAADPAPALDEFAFRLAGEHEPLRPEDVTMGLWRIERAGGTLYGSGEGSGLVLFELPESTGDPDPALTWPGGEWRPGEGIHERLAMSDPPMSVEFEAPATIEPGDDPTLSITATNEGEVPGRFLAGLNRVGPNVAYTPVQRVSFPVPAGGSETRDLTDTSVSHRGGVDATGDGQTDMTYHLDWTGERVSRSIRYVEDG